jgi:hypothetical protein
VRDDRAVLEPLGALKLGGDDHLDRAHEGLSHDHDAHEDVEHRDEIKRRQQLLARERGPRDREERDAVLRVVVGVLLGKDGPAGGQRDEAALGLGFYQDLAHQREALLDAQRVSKVHDGLHRGVGRHRLL